MLFSSRPFTFNKSNSAFPPWFLTDSLLASHVCIAVPTLSLKRRFFFFPPFLSLGMHVYVLSCLVVSNSLWPQAPRSMESSRQLHRSGVPFPTPDLPNLGTEPEPPASLALGGGFLTTREALLQAGNSMNRLASSHCFNCIPKSIAREPSRTVKTE